MIKTFVTVVSMLAEQDLLRLNYRPEGFELKKNRETSFPIIPVIASTVKENEEVRIIAIRPENEDASDNFETFLEELDEIGIPADCVQEISVIEKQTLDIGITLLMKVLQEIPADSLVYADITFGTKPVSAMLLYAMNFIEKLKDAEVEGIYYGEIPRHQGRPIYDRATIYELTAFKYLAGIIDELNQLEVKNPLDALQRLIDK